MAVATKPLQIILSTHLWILFAGDATWHRTPHTLARSGTTQAKQTDHYAFSDQLTCHFPFFRAAGDPVARGNLPRHGTSHATADKELSCRAAHCAMCNGVAEHAPPHIYCDAEFGPSTSKGVDKSRGYPTNCGALGLPLGIGGVPDFLKTHPSPHPAARFHMRHYWR